MTSAVASSHEASPAVEVPMMSAISATNVAVSWRAGMMPDLSMALMISTILSRAPSSAVMLVSTSSKGLRSSLVWSELSEQTSEST